MTANQAVYNIVNSLNKLIIIMKFTESMLLLSLIIFTGLLISIKPNNVYAFPFPPGNPNSGSSACYHNGVFEGMVYGGASCPEPEANHPKHCVPYLPCDLYLKHTLEDCIIVETPFND